MLLWSNGDTITMKQAPEHFGFVSQVVYEASILINASRVEDAIQNRFQHLEMGSQRLWCCVAKGKSSEKNDVNEPVVYKVFITYSTQVADKLREKISQTSISVTRPCACSLE